MIYCLCFKIALPTREDQTNVSFDKHLAINSNNVNMPNTKINSYKINPTMYMHMFIQRERQTDRQTDRQRQKGHCRGGGGGGGKRERVGGTVSERVKNRTADGTDSGGDDIPYWW